MGLDLLCKHLSPIDPPTLCLSEHSSTSLHHHTHTHTHLQTLTHSSSSPTLPIQHYFTSCYTSNNSAQPHQRFSFITFSVILQAEIKPKYHISHECLFHNSYHFLCVIQEQKCHNRKFFGVLLQRGGVETKIGVVNG